MKPPNQKSVSVMLYLVFLWILILIFFSTYFRSILPWQHFLWSTFSSDFWLLMTNSCLFSQLSPLLIFSPSPSSFSQVSNFIEWWCLYRLSEFFRGGSLLLLTSVLVASGGLEIWVSSTSFQKSNIDWPQQPPKGKVLKFNMIFHYSTKKYLFQNINVELNSKTWMTLKSSVVIF